MQNTCGILRVVSHIGRFTDRVSDYSSARPSYPEALLELLEWHGLGPGQVTADMGSGTGILTRLLLGRGADVYAVEPNESMRTEAERLLGDFAGFRSVAASAEESTLPDQSIHLITSAQAFHWFDVERTRIEWTRILKPRGCVALIWNERQDTSEFSRGYGALARAFVDEAGRARRRLADPTSMIRDFFGGSLDTHRFPHSQEHDWDGLKARALSSSYWPKAGPAHESSMNQLADLFARFERDGRVRFDYESEVFMGPLSNA